MRYLLLVLSLFGLFRLSFENDPAAFHEMDPLLKDGERAVAEVTGLEGARLALLDLKSWQEENVALKMKMGGAPAGTMLVADDLPRAWTFSRNGRDYLVLPSEKGVDLKAELKRMFDTLAAETYRLLAISLLFMILAILAFARKRFFSYVLPLLAAIVTTLGVLGFFGEPVNFFQLLCFFILMGLSIDYVVFHQNGGTSKVVFASFLTSTIGFGLLGLTSFAVTRSMGLTLAFGLVFAYLFSIKRTASASVSGDRTPKVPDSWASRPEQSAGRLRIAFLFLLYRLFGKSFVKIIIFFVVLIVYPFVRLGTDPKKCHTFRTILNFAWALMDKVDACSLRKNLPEMTVTGDTGWMKGGCFLLSTHVGTIEVLPALIRSKPSKPSEPPLVHAFQQMTHNKIFTDFFERWRDKSQFELHAVEEIGVETAVQMQDAIQRGEIVLMAGDRDPAAEGRKRRKGVFIFAKLMECPVYAITCVRTGWNAYTVNAQRLGADLVSDYNAFLASAIAQNPLEHFDF